MPPRGSCPIHGRRSARWPLISGIRNCSRSGRVRAGCLSTAHRHALFRSPTGKRCSAGCRRYRLHEFAHDGRHLLGVPCH
ncbi:hypothetical protein C3Y87_07245 [Carbonactinospora thermoautotrophica]|nr:hypothetical protein [Carbonactinospora thermoautotrophica]